MKEYIERDAAKNAIMEYHGSRVVSKYATSADCRLARSEIEACLYEIEDVPAADVVERVRGEWIERAVKLDWCEDDIEIHYECSICNELSCGASPFCPNCGADMRGEEHER